MLCFYMIQPKSFRRDLQKKPAIRVNAGFEKCCNLRLWLFNFDLNRVQSFNNYRFNASSKRYAFIRI